MNFEQAVRFLRNYRSGEDEFPFDPVGSLTLLSAILENIDAAFMNHEYEEYAEVLEKKHKVTLSRLLHSKSEAAWPVLIDLKKVQKLVFDQWEEFPYDHSRKDINRETLEKSMKMSVLEYNPVIQKWKVILDLVEQDSNLLRFSPVFILLDNEVIRSNLSTYFHDELVSSTRLFIKPRKKELPEFSKIVIWLWKDHDCIDTDGDSIPFDSKKWRALRMRNTDNYEEKVMIAAISENPLIFEIVGGVSYIVWRTAYFLGLETDAEISSVADFRMTRESKDLDKPHLLNNFDLDAAFKRTDDWVKQNLPGR